MFYWFVITSPAQESSQLDACADLVAFWAPDSMYLLFHLRQYTDLAKPHCVQMSPASCSVSRFWFRGLEVTRGEQYCDDTRVPLIKVFSLLYLKTRNAMPIVPELLASTAGRHHCWKDSTLSNMHQIDRVPSTRIIIVRRYCGNNYFVYRTRTASSY
jgi:hypothetical protein